MRAWKILFTVFAIQIGLCLSKCMRRGIECIDYDIISRNTEYEERQYPATVWISATTTGPSLSRAQGYLYKKLFRYIQGDNLKGMFVNSTAPTRTRVEPCQGDSVCEPTYTMSLLIPAGLFNDAPVPTDVDLYFEREAPQRYIVRSFGGRPSESKWLTEAQILADLGMKDSGVSQDHYYLNWYDPPLQLFNRLNEVWLLKTLKKNNFVQKEVSEQSELNEVC